MAGAQERTRFLLRATSHHGTADGSAGLRAADPGTRQAAFTRSRIMLRSNSAIAAMGSASWWWRLSLKRAVCISIDMRLRVTEVILDQPAKPPHLVSRLAQQTHHPEQHRNRDGAHQKSHRDRKSIQPSYPPLPLGRS